MADGLLGKQIAQNFAERQQENKNIETAVKRGEKLSPLDYLNPLNLLTVPQRAVVGTARALGGEESPFSTAFGTERGGSPSQFLDETGVINTSGTAGAFGGLALDVILDPLTLANPTNAARQISKVGAIADINQTVRNTRKANFEELGRFMGNLGNKAIDILPEQNAENLRANIQNITLKMKRNFLDKTAGVDKEYLGLIDRFKNGKNNLDFEAQDLNRMFTELVTDQAKREELGDILYTNIADVDKTTEIIREVLGRGGDDLGEEVASQVHSILLKRNQNQQQLRDLEVLTRGVVENNEYLRRIAKGTEDAGDSKSLLDYITGKRLIDDNEMNQIIANNKFKPAIIQKLDAMNKRQVPEDIFQEIIKSDAQGWYQVNPFKLKNLDDKQARALEKFMERPENMVFSKTGLTPERFAEKLRAEGVPNVFDLKNFGGYEKDFALVLSDTMLKQKGALLQNQFLQNMQDMSKARKDFMMIPSDMIDEVKSLNPNFEKNYTKLEGDRFGKFQGSYIENSIADNMGEIAQLKNTSQARQIYNLWNGAWKKSNTALNFGSHVNQMIGNMIHMDIMGFRARDLKHIRNAWDDFKTLATHEVAGTVPEKGTSIRKLFESGLFQGTIKTDLNDFQKSVGSVNKNEIQRLYEIIISGKPSKFADSLNGNLVNKMTNIFGLEDNAARFFMFEKLRAERFGTKAVKDLNQKELDSLVQDVKSKFVNYDRSGKWVDMLAQHPVIGSPFIRFAVGNAGLWMKEALYNPWKYGKYRVMVDQFNRWSASQNGIPEDQYEKRVAQSTPDYMDLASTVQFGRRPDGTRYFFNGSKYDTLSDFRAGRDGLKGLLRGGVIGDAFTELSTGRDTFSGQEISVGESLLKSGLNSVPLPFLRMNDIKALANSAVTPKGRFGEDKPAGLQALKTLTGLNVSIKNPDLQRRRRIGQVNKEIQRKRSEINKLMLNTNNTQRQQELREEFLRFKEEKLRQFM